MIQDTSRELYKTLCKYENEDKEAVISALSNLGSATDNEIAKHLGEDHPEDCKRYRPRRSELVNDGRVIEVARRHCKVSGNTCIVWALHDGNPIKRELGLSNAQMNSMLKNLGNANKFQLNKLRNVIERLEQGGSL